MPSNFFFKRVTIIKFSSPHRAQKVAITPEKLVSHSGQKLGQSRQKLKTKGGNKKLRKLKKKLVVERK
jgi:hypothetical protein